MANIGDRYIVGAAPTGDWAGQANKIAYYDTDNAWKFYTPSEGWQVYVASDTANYVFTGTVWDKQSVTSMESAAKANSVNIKSNSTTLLSLSSEVIAAADAVQANSAAITSNDGDIQAVSNLASHALSLAVEVESAASVDATAIQANSAAITVVGALQTAISAEITSSQDAANSALSAANANSDAITANDTERLAVSGAVVISRSANKADSALVRTNSVAITNQDVLITAKESNLISLTEKAAAEGVATLDGSGDIPTTQLPDTILGTLQYQGTWDCSTAAYPVAPEDGDFYICGVAGDISAVDYAVGDWLTYTTATGWKKIDNSNKVGSVNGQTGSVVLSWSDLNAQQANSDVEVALSNLEIDRADVDADMVLADSATVANSALISVNAIKGAAVSDAMSNALSSTVVNKQGISSNVVSNAAVGVEIVAAQSVATVARADVQDVEDELGLVSAAVAATDSSTVVNLPLLSTNTIGADLNTSANSALTVDKLDQMVYLTAFGVLEMELP